MQYSLENVIIVLKDTDKDGKIGTEDWKRTLSVLKQECHYELEDMYYAEFTKIAHEITNDPEETEDAIDKTFRMLDASNKGYISVADIREAMMMLGDPLTDEEVTAVIKEITKKAGDRITLQDFRKTFLDKQ